MTAVHSRAACGHAARRHGDVCEVRAQRCARVHACLAQPPCLKVIVTLATAVPTKVPCVLPLPPHSPLAVLGQTKGSRSTSGHRVLRPKRSPSIVPVGKVKRDKHDRAYSGIQWHAVAYSGMQWPRPYSPECIAEATIFPRHGRAERVGVGMRRKLVYTHNSRHKTATSTTAALRAAQV